MTDLLHPESLVLRPSKKKFVGLLMISAGFVVTGLWLLQNGDISPTLGWVCVAFFGLGTVVGVATLLPGAAYLRLEPEGFTMCSLYRSAFYRWSDVSEFVVGRVGMQSMVMFEYSSQRTDAATLRAVNAALFGHQAALPDTYGMTHEALVDLLNRQRASALAGH